MTSFLCKKLLVFQSLGLLEKMEEVSVGAAGSTSVVDLSGDSHLQVILKQFLTPRKHSPNIILPGWYFGRLVREGQSEVHSPHKNRLINFLTEINIISLKLTLYQKVCLSLPLAPQSVSFFQMCHSAWWGTPQGWIKMLEPWNISWHMNITRNWTWSFQGWQCQGDKQRA